MDSAADLGLLILCQPASYRFDWEQDQSHRHRHAVRFPSLLKTTDNGGRRLSEPEVIVPSDVVKRRKKTVASRKGKGIEEPESSRQHVERKRIR